MIRLYVCEDCQTFSRIDDWQKHITHRRQPLDSTGDDWEALERIAVRHLVFARRIRSGTVDDGTLQAELSDAVLKADWFSQEDADAYDVPNAGYKIDE